jgi:transposase
MSYSIDLRESVIAFIENGGSKIAASRLFQVSCRTVFMWIQNKKERGNLKVKTRDSKPYKIDETALIAYVKKNPDHYLKQIAKHFHVTAPAIFFALKRLKITLKKKRSSTLNDAKKNVRTSLRK